ncbi:uncharacterized protein I206_107095 [Kwoniella pini CBS 10737]|uniref:Actin cytoskeleton-regulatory complex protein SLA1 n=1 Tax=Kwoniella pini CBS 10737 TaxID=1296096 RepID=A0A1B9HZ80_9TREE|nr:uncharacterized protein I206_05361 [Kwoniella pini CBS 10737]OCF48582.1 hypothetical protein I206_05361 [Kwoniella pini CBS 10737]
MAYVAVAKALYDYDAQDPETEISFKEDQIFYIIEKEDDDWWKAKAKDDEGDAEGSVGLLPASYVEEIPPVNTTRALFAYESTSPEELSMGDESTLHVYSIEEDWLLVKIEGGDERLGFVPRNYCEPMDASAELEVEDAADAAAEIEAARQAEKEKEIAEKQRQLKLKDKVETWSISELDGKKKKKGTLGVGNAAVFFASDTDKSAPVRQFPISDLISVAQPSSKTLDLTFATLGQPLHFHCGGSDTTKAILAKLETSKAAAGEALEMINEARGGYSSAEEETLPPPTRNVPPSSAAEPRGVRFAPETAPASSASAETATVQYDFDADGDDELTVKDGETVTIVDKENDEWWLVRNLRGKEGVVPAAYVQLNDGSAQQNGAAVEEHDSEDEREREAEAAAQLDAERKRQAQAAAEERRRIQVAAEARRAQEEEDRQLAEAIQEEQREKAARKALKRQEEERRQREANAETARERARSGGMQPPKITKRPSNNDVAAAAEKIPTRGHAAPARPPENNRPKPNPNRIRTWSDKSGQFNVEAEYLGLNGNKIRLHKVNGVIIEVPMDKMSSRDSELIRRHEAKKRAASMDDDDVPLGQSSRRNGNSTPPVRSTESQRRAAPAEEPIPPEAMAMPKPRKPRFDWFEFFLSAGCDMDDCTRYASNFERDRIDESILPELESSTLRTLGLKEGDVIRVRKAIQNRFAKKTPEQQAQIDQDMEYARQLQEFENSGRKGTAPQPPPGLFTGPGGKLSNNTRRGRPEKKSSGIESVDPSALAAASDQLAKTFISTPPQAPTPPPMAVSPPPVEEKKPAPLIAGFDDDAWTIKPTSKPASPAPSAPPAPPAPPIFQTTPAPALTAAPTGPANNTDSLLAQINALRPASTGISANDTGGSGSFDTVSKMVGQPRPPAQNYGLGMQNTGQPMSQLYGQQTGFQPQQQQQSPQPTGPRGPLAPVPANAGLLNPMQPNMTGMFVPTRGMSPMTAQQTGFSPQQQPQQQMMAQPTGYQAGFQQGYGGQQQQLGIQPNFTGYPGGMGMGMQQPQMQQQSSFNAIANMPPPQQAQGDQNKFAPSNIFAAMKKNDFGKPEEQQPQSSNKYDALRPLTTGYNGAPGQMMPQQTGYGMGMMPQQTGYNMGMMPNMTGYNPMMGNGYQQQQQNQGQNPYGYR